MLKILFDNAQMVFFDIVRISLNSSTIYLLYLFNGLDFPINSISNR